MATLNKALQVLEAFLGPEREMGLTALASQTNLNISTVHRVASVLVKRGYLVQKYRAGKYSLGPRLLQFSSLAANRITIRDVAIPFLQKLNKELNESVNLAVLDSNEALYVENTESNHQLRIFTQVGAKVPLYCTGVGKIFLAHLTKKEQEEYLSGCSFKGRTEYTITDLRQLKEELLSVRRQGIAMDSEEMEMGVKCIAAPIRDGKGNVVAAISVSGPSTRLSNYRMREIEPLIKVCTSEISIALGYRDEVEAGVVK